MARHDGDPTGVTGGRRSWARQSVADRERAKERAKSKRFERAQRNLRNERRQGR